MRHDNLGRAARFEVAVAIREADDGVGIGDVDPFGIVPGRIERDAERAVEAVRECRGCRLVLAISAQDDDAAGAAFGGENIAVGRRSD
jgi:hypothetical protein